MNKNKKGFQSQINKFSDKQKILIICYGLWLISHLFLLFSSNNSYKFSDFIIYSLGVPLLFLLIFILYKKYKRALEAEPKEKNELFKKQRKKAIYSVLAWAAFCFVVSLLDYWEDGTYDKEDLLRCILIGSIVLPFFYIWKELCFIWRKVRKFLSID